jgi:TatD DNase family protein
VHPGRPDALETFDLDRFSALLSTFAVVGEVGLDRRGSLAAQKKVFGEVLRVCQGAPVLVSIHSAGRVRAVLDLLQAVAVPAPVLHWFLGSESDLAIAVQSGAYFSVNAAMSRDLVRAIPSDRVLTESDFPGRGTRARRPGDVTAVEAMLAEAWGVPQDVARHRVWVNFKRLLIASGAIDRVSDALSDHVLSV